MPQTDRAPNEVAKHFYDKYGREGAVSMISSRLERRSVKQDFEFWLDVLKIIHVLDGQDSEKNVTKSFEENASPCQSAQQD